MAEKIRVLMVDDEEQFRSTTAKILSRRGYETSMAASGEEAIAILKKSDQDVVVLDIKMPGMDGHQALVEIKKIKPDLPVIMLTGHGAEESARDSLKKGAFDYLAKPCDIDLLAARIKEAMAVKGHVGPREEKTAVEIMIPLDEYTTIDAESTVRESILALKKSFEGAMATGKVMETGHRSIVVFDKKGAVVGILSIIDLIRGLQPAYLSFPKPSTADSLQYSPVFWRGLFTVQAKDIADRKIKDLMSEPARTIDFHTNLMEIANFMVTKQIRRVVVTHQGKPIGVVREQELFFELAAIILKQ